MIEPFRIHVPDAELDDLRERLARTRWPDDLANEDWRYGANTAYIRTLADHWLHRYDWRAREAAMNAFPHFRTRLGAQPIHFVHVRGKGPSPMPLVLNHGWPWTFWDFHKVIGPLSDPAAHGGDPADAFDVVVPSLPGYGFSTPLAVTGLNFWNTADLWVELMERLGYPRFATQGGDWGSFLSAQLGHKYPERVIVGHPFNPPYLIPLVEVVGGERTAPETLDWASAFYAHCGKRPLKLKREIAGFVANRLQGAVYREIINLARLDIASMADIDAAIAHGPGLRWAVMGPSLNFHLARQTGIWDFLDSFVAEFNTYDLADGKTAIDRATHKRMVDGVVEATGGRSNDDLARERDQAIIDLIEALRERDLPD